MFFAATQLRSSSLCGPKRRVSVGVSAPEKTQKAIPPNTALLHAPQIPKLEPVPLPSVILEKVLDTADDVFTHVKRSWRPHPQRSGNEIQLRQHEGRLEYDDFDRPVVLVLGSGWAAHSFVKVVDTDLFDIVVVSPRNHFVFTPMLPGAAVGSVEFRSLLEPVRMSNPHVAYFEAVVDSIDFDKKVAHCSSSSVPSAGSSRPPIEFDIPYTHAVVGVGEQPATFGIPGVKEHCFFMKEVRDCVRLRNRIQEQFELAEFLEDSGAQRDALRFVVVGGGPTGVEFAGTLSDFVKQDLVKRYPLLVPLVEVILVQASASILEVFDRDLQERALQNLERLSIRVLTNVAVREVAKETMRLSTGEDLGYGLCLWSAGNAARPLVNAIIDQLPEQQALAHPRPSARKLAVDPFLRIVGAESAFAVGDCASVVTGPLPPSAQVAGQQGAYVARTVNRATHVGIGGLNQRGPTRWVEAKKHEEERNRFSFLSLGLLAYVGDSQAVVKVDLGGAKFWGGFAHLLWRSVYLTKQVSMRNRVLIAFDWMKSRIFGRDVSMF